MIPPTADHALSIDEAYADLVNRTRHARMSLVSAPPVSYLFSQPGFMFICARRHVM